MTLTYPAGTGNEISTGDIMDAGSQRTFKERTGFIAAGALPANLLDNLPDTGPGTINRLTGVNLTFTQTTYPVPRGGRLLSRGRSRNDRTLPS